MRDAAAPAVHNEPTMMPIHVRGLALASLMAVFVPLGTGCYAEVDTPPVYAEGGIEPEYYDGYVVYYDDIGRPYYYANGAVVWIPATSPYYGRYVAHWRAYGPRYRTWYANYGYRYRAYRHPYRR
jgi:hypothetical protein